MKEPFAENSYYHIFNCANGNENLYQEPTNYIFFLEKFFYYIESVADTFAFCLLKNHFHILIRIHELEFLKKSYSFKNSTNISDIDVNKIVSNQFSKIFNSYAKAFNKKYNRKGSLFQSNLKRKKINQQIYLQQLVLYIHNNPVKHGFVEKIEHWPYSSWNIYKGDNSKTFQNLENINRHIKIEETIKWFEDKENFEYMHKAFDYTKVNSVFDLRNYGSVIDRI